MNHRDIDIDIDINAVKRTRGASDDGNIQDSRRKKGKERADPGPPQQQQFVFQVPSYPTQGNSTLEDNQGVARTVRGAREKKPLSSHKVTPPNIMKLLNQPTDNGVSILQYLAKDKNACRDLRENLVAMHRSKPRNGGTTVIINELKNTINSSDEDSDYSRDYFDDSTNNSSYDYMSEDETDTIIDYPFNLKKLMNSQPVRTMIGIGDKLLIATVDTGAAISVMSRGLADQLGLTLVKVNKRFALTGFNNATSETSLVAQDVSIRIGGKLRKEHFCIDNSIRDREVCLLGRTWLSNHSIKIDLKENTLLIPSGGNFIEIACIRDHEEEMDVENALTVPVFNVCLNQGQDGEQWDQGLNTYHEDIVSVQESEDGDHNKHTLEEVLDGVPEVIQEVVKGNLNTFYEYGGLGRVNNVYHEIITSTEEPIQSKPYRLTVDEEECLKEELKTLLELDIIRPSIGKYTSPVFFVPKKDGKLRLVVNFQKLNAITVKDGYPLPHIDDILDSIGGYQCYTVLDAAFGFWQIPMHPNSIDKSGFCCKMGVFPFSVMAMGLQGSPSTYQRCMNSILQEYLLCAKKTFQCFAKSCFHSYNLTAIGCIQKPKNAYENVDLQVQNNILQ